jgi:acetyl esterase/lipase
LPRGFILVSVNSRMLPAHVVREPGEDVARALAFVLARAPAWGGDPARVVLMGHSAGAQLVALLSSAPSRWAGLGLKPWLGTVALDGAAIDTEAVMARRHFPLYDRVFGADPALWRAVSPLAALQPGALPLLAVCSSVRRDDPCAEAARYAERARKVGTRVEVRREPRAHDEINADLGRPNNYTAAVEHFLGSLDAEVARRLHRGG